jgi:hypothetical protein
MGAIGVELRICLLAASRECDVTGKLEVIAWSIGLVPRNALVFTDLANFRVAHAEVTIGPRGIRPQQTEQQKLTGYSTSRMRSLTGSSFPLRLVVLDFTAIQENSASYP